MKRCLPLLVSVCVLGLLLQVTGEAQGSGPEIDILGRPDASSNPPNVNTYVSVINPDTGRAIDGLGIDNFSVQVSGEEVDTTVSTETSGIAVAIVIDRGGIARSGDRRIEDAVNLADSLLGRLNVDGTDTADMVSLIGIRGRDNGGLTPLVPFTDYDPNLIRNEFDALRTEAVSEVTPLYDGIDQALEWFTENTDDQLQDKLNRRRQIIVVFSDGIDNQFSSEAHETIIINKCVDNGILLYAVRMEGGPTDADNMEALAVQTNGIYVTHTPATEGGVESFFDDIVTQRQTYRLTFPLRRRQGDYEVRVRVLDTPAGDGSDISVVSSPLQLPEINLTSPIDGESFGVPFVREEGGYGSFVVTLSAEVRPRDGITRDPAEVSYFANGVRIGSGNTAPSFDFDWDVGDIVTATDEIEVREYTFVALANDPYLEERIESAPVTVRVTWEAAERSVVEETEKWFLTYWWLLIILVFFALGLLVLLIMLIRTRGQLAKKLVAQTTGVVKGVTRRLGAAPSKAPGKLVIVKGVNVGREYRLDIRTIKVGRDPQFSDFPLYDEFTSNPHFSVQMDQNNFYITDEGSTNGTRINGVPIRPRQRVLLQPDAIVEAGQTKLQFKRLGGETRQLGGGRKARKPASPPAGPKPPTLPAAGSDRSTRPSLDESSSSGQEPSDDKPRRGGPTRRVM
jgi:Mg-chelatase subunit ChlD